MRRLKLQIKNEYGKKDIIKSLLATKFIGVGVGGSSTALYARQWKAMFPSRTNVPTYSRFDKVFVSVNGDRPGRVPFKSIEFIVAKAIEARATILTDTVLHRKRPYNIGEQELAAYLMDNNYVEVEPGVWKYEDSSS